MRNLLISMIGVVALASWLASPGAKAQAPAPIKKEKEINGLQDRLLNAQATLSDEKRDDLSRQLKRKRVEFERLNDDANADFQEAASRAQAKLISIFRGIVTKYGTERGFTVILETGTVYFASESVDITDEMLARFNAATPSGASSPPKN